MEATKLKRLKAFLLDADRIMRIIWNEFSNNQVLRMVWMSVFYLWLQRQLNHLKNSLYDFLFCQIRFHSSEAQMMIRTFVSEKLMDSAVGMEVTTHDEGIGRSEVLHSNSSSEQGAEASRQISYDLTAHGAAPVHVTHIPIASNSTWLWLASKQAPWYTIPIIWIRPDRDSDIIWDSIPGIVKRIIVDSGLLQLLRRYLPVANRQGGGRGASSSDANKLVVSTLWWNGDLVTNLVNDAIQFTQKSRTRSCVINRLTIFGVKRIYAPPRKMETVILGPKGQELLQDIKRFFRRREWYRANDLPYQRVYLLHGPPGNGKSSFLQALAILFRIDYYYLQLASKNLNREVLRNNLKDFTLQNKCVVVLEDAESIFTKEKASDASKQEEEARKMALSTAVALAAQNNPEKKGVEGIKAAIEGVNNPSDFGVKIEDFVELISGMLNPPCGRLIFFTTNHCNRLHEEILRVVDEQGTRVEFPNADLSIMRGMWRQFYKGVKDSMRFWDDFERQFLALYGRSDLVSITAVREKATFEVLISTKTTTTTDDETQSSSLSSSSTSSAPSSSLHTTITVSTRMLLDDAKAASPSSSSSSSSNSVGDTKGAQDLNQRKKTSRDLSLRVSLAPKTNTRQAKNDNTRIAQHANVDVTGSSSSSSSSRTTTTSSNAKRVFDEGFPFTAQLVKKDGDRKDDVAESTSSMEIKSAHSPLCGSGCYPTATEALLAKTTTLDNIYSFVLPGAGSTSNKRCLKVDNAGRVSAADMKSLPAKERHLATFQARFCTRFSAAAMQEHMMRFRNSPEKAARNVHVMLQK